MARKVEFSPPYLSDKIINRVIEVLKSRWWTTGPQTRQFEEMLRQETGAKEVICVNSCTSALFLSLKACGIGNGDHVVVPALTYSATASSVIHAGGKPLFADIDYETMTISPESIARVITPNTRAVIPVDYAGIPANYDKIIEVLSSVRWVPQNEVQEWCGRPLIIADSAHSFGAIYRGKRIGSHSEIVCFSFHAVKNLSTGEGGAIALNMPPNITNRISEFVRIMSLHGQTKSAYQKFKEGKVEYDIVGPGWKMNMMDILSAIGIGMLEDYWNAILPHRHKIYSAYEEVFRDWDRAKVIPLRGDYYMGSAHFFPLRIMDITLEEKEKLIRWCYDRGVHVNVHFKPLPYLTAYRELCPSLEHIPNTLKAYKEEVSLPIHTEMSVEDAYYVAEVVMKFFKGR